MNETSTLEVFILDKPYRVNCPAEEQEALRQSAAYLDKKMRDIRNSGKIIGLERIAVIAALNISHELLAANRHAKADGQSLESLGKLIARLDQAIEAVNNG